MRMKAAIIVCGMLCLCIAGAIVLEVRRHDVSVREEAKSVGLTWHVLYVTRDAIRAAQEATGRAPPLTIGELLSFIQGYSGQVQEPMWDMNVGTISDGWGQPILIVTDGARVVGLASKGPNGRWDGGHGDDILVELSSK